MNFHYIPTLRNGNKLKQLKLKLAMANSQFSHAYYTLLFFLTANLLSAQTWTGATNNNWHVSTNWSTNTVPVASGDVIISNTPNQPTISSSAVAKSIVVQTNALLNINSTGTLTISGSSFYGIENFGSIINNGTIQVNLTNGHAINGESGSAFTNNGTLKIGSTDNIGSFGIYTDSNTSFTNEVGGTIIIDRVGSDAIRNGNTFTNKATINIGGIASVARHGIANFGTFNNQSGVINIDKTGGEAIFSHSPFINNATISIGVISNIGGNGIMNDFSTFTNEKGIITIDQTVLDGIQNINGGTFTNKATLAIGSSNNIRRNGILNLANFVNEKGTLSIDRTSGNIAILNTPASSFTNKASIMMGTFTGISTGIENNGIFINESGTINIDRTSTFGIYNLPAASFTNKAILNIGVNGFISRDGLLNRGAFTNTNTGSMGISQTNGNGIQSEASFINQGTITVTALANPFANGIANFANPSAATFINDFCGTISLSDNLFNNSVFTNRGLFKINTVQTHDNSALTNNGIIEYIQGNPLSNVTNNGFIVAPKSGACTILNILQKGNAPNFTVASNWYKDAELTELAGTYNQTSNIFTSNSLSVGVNTLYFNISDNTNGCPRTVAIKINFNNIAPSVFLTSPTNNSVGASNLTLSANATDPDGQIAQVNFYLVYFGGKSGVSRTLIGSANAAPYNFNWNNVAGGFYTIQAEAIDDCGAKVYSSFSGVNVLETFNVFISSPTSGQGFVPGSSLTIAASVIGYTQRTVVKVEFFKDNIKLGEDASEPYTYLWNNVPQGNYALRAVVTDNLGGVWTSPLTFILGINAGTGGGRSASRIEQVKLGTYIELSPNPTSDIVNFKTNIAKEGVYVLSIYDAMGHKLLSKEKTYEKGSTDEVIDFSGYAQGIYAVMLTNKAGQRFSIQKLVVQ